MASDAQLQVLSQPKDHAAAGESSADDWLQVLSQPNHPTAGAGESAADNWQDGWGEPGEPTEQELLDYFSEALTMSLAGRALAEPGLVADKEARAIARGVRKALALQYRHKAAEVARLITAGGMFAHLPECWYEIDGQLVPSTPKAAEILAALTAGRAAALELLTTELPAAMVAALLTILGLLDELAGIVEILSLLGPVGELALPAEHAHEHAQRRPKRCQHRPRLVALSLDDPAPGGAERSTLSGSYDFSRQPLEAPSRLPN